MRRDYLATALASYLILAFAATGGAQAGTDDTAALVTRMARVGRASSPTFSPDGRRLAFVSDMSGVPQIWVMSTDGGWPTLVTNDNDPVGSVTWSPASDWLAYSLAPGGGMNTQVYVIKADGSGRRLLTKGGKETNRLFQWTHDGRHLATGTNTRNPSAIDAYLTDPVTGESRMVVQNDALATLEDVSRDGKWGLVSRLVSRGDNNLYLVHLESRKETLLTPHTGPGTFAGELSPDGRTVYLVSNKDRDLLAFARIELAADGSPGPIEVIAERPDAEVGNFRINDQGTLAVLVWNVGGRDEMSLVELPSGRTSAGPELPAELVGGLGFSPDGTRLAMNISGAAAPSDIWVMDVATKGLRQVTHVPHAGVDLSQLVRPDLVKFKAHDGLELSGWLYRPKGQTGPGPYAISFHGGPEGQERPSFRSDYQSLLAAGIGVFAPNVRGSSGFGKRFVNLDNGELRFDGLKDIESCYEYLVSSGIADPKRVGITGGSYGGYMTLAGVTEYPDMFAAGVDLFGMVNFFTFFEHTEPWMAAISTTEYGDPQTQPALLRRLSPLAKLIDITTPLQVQHGANDTNVPVVEAEQVVANLKKRGVPVEYILFPDEGHGWRKTANRVTSTVKLVEFFTMYLKGPGR
ncbi:MAG: prolyl oligopeptidase family serine peptidase [Vicinamibacterales bacterium]